MALLQRMHGAAGIKIIIGSAFLWAWLDALFMSTFFFSPEVHSDMPEFATITVFGWCLPFLIFTLVSKAPVKRLLANKKVLLGFAAAGTAGSLLLILAGINESWLILMLGSVLAGGFMAVYELAWGAAYAHDGVRSATPYVAGGFAFAVVIDTPLLLMFPEASAIFFALLPLISGLFFVSIDPEQRTYRRRKDEPMPPVHGMQSKLKRYLGVSLMLLGAVVLIMIGFGYMQHLVSFSYIASSDQTNGIFIQLARGISAILMFAVVIITPRRSSVVYRIGLLAMIAGFMMMPFMFGTPLFWLSGAVIIVGYTALDLLLWVAFSQIAYAQSKDPLKTIALLRILAVVCYMIGAVIGIVLVGNGKELHEFVSAETTVVGYLVVIATVLLLSTDDVWTLFGRQNLSATGSADDSTGMEQRLETCFESFGLTAREREIATLLAYGRTQPWIAERLSISENTVGTHVRHIYQKAGVHDRQQFIDIVLFPTQDPLSESRDNDIPSR